MNEKEWDNEWNNIFLSFDTHHRGTLYWLAYINLEDSSCNIFGLWIWIRCQVRFDSILCRYLLSFLFFNTSNRFLFIVLTDTICWIPIIVSKYLALSDVELPSDLHAWIIVFALPLNSAMNPFLYTFTTPKYRDHILAIFSTRRSFTKKQESTSHHSKLIIIKK